MTGFRAMLALAATALAGFAAPVAAQDSASAALRVYSGAATNLRWFGSGPARTRVGLCVVSSSGRFRLEISSESGGRLVGPDRLPYEIRFRDGAGHEQTLSTEGLATVQFEGAAPPAEGCSAGPNAELELTLSEAALQRGLAGSYFDRLQFSVSPL